MQNKTQQKGKEGELIAEAYLVKKNYQIVETNFHSLYGEIDIIAEEPVSKNLVIVEVKYYKKNSYLDPKLAITKRKISNIIKTTRYYLGQNNLMDVQIRFDLITIKNKQVCEHLENIFDGYY